MIKQYLLNTFQSSDDSKSTLLEKFITAIIIISVISTVLETEQQIYTGNEHVFRRLEYVFLGIFSFEYILRLLLCGNIHRFSGFSGKIKYIFSPLAILDLLAILPALLIEFSSDLFLLRILRLFRMLRILKLLKSNKSIGLFLVAVIASRYQLYASLAVTLFLLFVGSIMLYLLEGSVQPEQFGSIPRAMWWAMATLTTVGYGDVFPITPLGKVMAGVVAICGIGIIAMPAGIIAANFGREYNNDTGEEEKS
jgi:voltage-gated potassium channel